MPNSVGWVPDPQAVKSCHTALCFRPREWFSLGTTAKPSNDNLFCGRVKKKGRGRSLWHIQAAGQLLQHHPSYPFLCHGCPDTSKCQKRWILRGASTQLTPYARADRPAWRPPATRRGQQCPSEVTKVCREQSPVLCQIPKEHRWAFLPWFAE